jgi:hypothetical protein
MAGNRIQIGEAISHFYADTLGVLFRALTGRLDPWTKQHVRKAKRRVSLQATRPAANPGISGGYKR